MSCFFNCLLFLFLYNYFIFYYIKHFQNINTLISKYFTIFNKVSGTKVYSLEKNKYFSVLNQKIFPLGKGRKINSHLK